MVSHVEQMLREIPEVESTSRRTGLQLGLAAVTEANRGDILGEAEEQAQPRRGRDHGRSCAPASRRRNRQWTSSSCRCCRT